MTTDPTDQSDVRPSRPSPEVMTMAAEWFAEREARKITAEALAAWLSSPAGQAVDAINRVDRVRAHDQSCDSLLWLWLPTDPGCGDPTECADCGLTFQNEGVWVPGSEKGGPRRCMCCVMTFRRGKS